MVEQEANQTVANLNKAINQFNLLQLRLDTSNILNDIKMFMEGEMEFISQNQDTGLIERRTQSIGLPKANKHGVASVLNWASCIVNPHVVQGNFPVRGDGHSDMFETYIMECQMNLGEMLMINLYNYEIKEEEYQMIIDSLMNLIIPFMTRLLGNKERSSYGETFKEVSSSTASDSRKFPTFASNK